MRGERERERGSERRGRMEQRGDGWREQEKDMDIE